MGQRGSPYAPASPFDGLEAIEGLSRVAEPRPAGGRAGGDLFDRYERSSAPVGVPPEVSAGGIRAGRDPQAVLQRELEPPLRATEDEPIDPHASIYSGAYDGKRMSDDDLRRVFSRSPRTIDRWVARLDLRPDDIARARELALIDDKGAQRLANRSLEALERAGFEDLPREIRYTQPGPFYFQVGKDDEETLRAVKVAMGLDPDRRASQSSNPEDNRWDFAALERLKREGRLDVVDRFGQSIDIFSTTRIDGRQERLVNPKVQYRSIDYEADPEHGDEKRMNALNGDKVMIEAWNHDLSRPEPGIIYEVPSYEMPAFNEGEKVDVHRDDTQLWRFETLEEPGRNGLGRVGHVSGEVNLVARPRDQIAARLTAELGAPPDDAALDAAVDAYERARGWAKNAGMSYIRYPQDQTPAGNAAMIDAGMRDPDQGVAYWESTNRYNGGHVIAASLGGLGEGINVTAQAEGNNQDLFAQVRIEDPAAGVSTLRVTESWHDFERHIKNLTYLESEGLTLRELESQGFRIPAEVKARYGEDERVRFDVRLSIRSWYEDEGTEDEAPETRHTREFARLTGTRLVEPSTGEVLGELTMANYNIGASDEDYGRKIQMLFDSGFLDREGGYAEDADMSVFLGSPEPPPDVRGGGYLDEMLPSLRELRGFTSSPEFREVWGPNIPRSR